MNPRLRLVFGAMISLVAFQGCAALGLPAAAGVAAIEGGSGAVVKAGTEYGSNGVVYRTFVAPAEDVHAAILDTLTRLEIDVRKDTAGKKGWKIVAAANGRRIDVRLEPVTPVMTRLRLVVKKGVLGKDRATASQIVEQAEQMLEDTSQPSVRR